MSCTELGFCDIPDEILLYILSKVDSFTLKYIASTICARWKAISYNALQIKQKDFENSFYHGSCLIKKYYPHKLHNKDFQKFCKCFCHYYRTLSVPIGVNLLYDPTFLSHSHYMVKELPNHPVVSKSTNIFTPRYKHATCYHKGHIYVFGGQPEPSSKLNDLWKINVLTMDWTKIIYNSNVSLSNDHKYSRNSNDIPCPRSSATLVALPYNIDKLVLFGGHALASSLFELPRMLNTLHMFDITTNKWSKIDPLANFQKNSQMLSDNTEYKTYRNMYNSRLVANTDISGVTPDDIDYSDLRASFLHPPATAGHTAAIFELNYDENIHSNHLKESLIDSSCDSLRDKNAYFPLSSPLDPTANVSFNLTAQPVKCKKGLFMLVFGGLCSPGPYSSNALWVFDFQQMSWSPAPIDHNVRLASSHTRAVNLFSSPNVSSISSHEDGSRSLDGNAEHHQRLMTIPFTETGPTSRFNHSHAPLRESGDWLIIGGISTSGYKYHDAWILRTGGFFFRESLNGNPASTQQPSSGLNIRLPWYWVEIKTKNIFTSLARSCRLNRSCMNAAAQNAAQFQANNNTSTSNSNIIHNEDIKSEFIEVDENDTFSGGKTSSTCWSEAWPSNLWARSATYLHTQQMLVVLAPYKHSQLLSNNQNTSNKGSIIDLLNLRTQQFNAHLNSVREHRQLQGMLQAYQHPMHSSSESDHDSYSRRPYSDLFHPSINFDQRLDPVRNLPISDNMEINLSSDEEINVTPAHQLPALVPDMSNENNGLNKSPHFLDLERPSTSNKHFCKVTTPISSTVVSSEAMPRHGRLCKLSPQDQERINRNRLTRIERMKQHLLSREYNSHHASPAHSNLSHNFIGFDANDDMNVLDNDIGPYVDLPITGNDIANRSAIQDQPSHLSSVLEAFKMCAYCDCDTRRENQPANSINHSNDKGTKGTTDESQISCDEQLKIETHNTPYHLTLANKKRKKSLYPFYLDLKPLVTAINDFDERIRAFSNENQPLSKVFNEPNFDITCFLSTHQLPVLEWRVSDITNGLAHLGIYFDRVEHMDNMAPIPETIFYSLDSCDDCQIVVIGGARISVPYMANHVPEITPDKVTNETFKLF